MEENAKRNFENYKTRREAFLAYDDLCNSRKTPIWAEDDGIHCVIVVDFNDWIWLPVKGDQKYSVGEYCEKYLGRKYP